MSGSQNKQSPSGASGNPDRFPSSVRILACKVFYHELEYLGVPSSQTLYLDQGLHRTPADLNQKIKKSLAKWDQDPGVDTVVLVYGYCGEGLQGIRAQNTRLVFPLVQDCIPLLLGREINLDNPVAKGTFYLSPGWIDFGNNPLTEFRETAQKFGYDEAKWVARQLMKGYDRLLLIGHDGAVRDKYLEYAEEMAEVYAMKVEEVLGDLAWLQRLVAIRGGGGVAVLDPGEVITRDMFAGAPGAAVLD